MAKEKTPEAQATTTEVAEKYSAAEIALNAQHLFGYSQDLASAALEIAGKETYTLAEAKETIKAFAERKVD